MMDFAASFHWMTGQGFSNTVDMSKSGENCNRNVALQVVSAPLCASYDILSYKRNVFCAIGLAKDWNLSHRFTLSP